VHGHEIRSENAAKPIAQASAYLVGWLKSNVRCKTALDYGCGKLRYAVHLARRVERLTCVDSQVQLSRQQKVAEATTTVRDYAQGHLSARVLNIEQFAGDRTLYDFVLCANVLSAIPRARVRSKALRRLKRCVRPGGRALFVAQFRNTYFRDVLASGRAEEYLDGFLLNTSKHSSYYGLLDPPRLVSLLKRHGYEVAAAWTRGESAYVLTR